MVAAAAHVAFILPSGPEMIVILLVGIMLFGRRLPEVGRSVAKTVVQLRQGLHKLKAEMDLDKDLHDVADSFRETRSELTQLADVPRAARNPGRMLQNLTDETLSSIAPPDLFDSDGSGLDSAGTGEAKHGRTPATNGRDESTTAGS